MANISQGSTENIVLGEGYSPWALSSNDLYPDSTSYIVGIGNSNPDTLLHLTHTSNPQLKLDDGTDNVTFDVNSNAMVVHHDSSWDLKIDSNAGANANIRFSEAGTSKAGILHRGDTASGMVEMDGWFKWKVQAASTATVNLSAIHGNVVACDVTSNAMQINLPTITNYSGTALYIIDSKSNAGTNNITIAVQTGEKLDGTTNGTAVINTDNGKVLVAATADGWWAF